jgi:hypothetical protein
LDRFDVLMSKIIFLKKKHHWHAFWHEKLFEKHPQQHCQTCSQWVENGVATHMHVWDYGNGCGSKCFLLKNTLK